MSQFFAASSHGSFRVGANVWRVCNAKRATVLIDADDFFRAATQAMSGAEEQILIVGWDLDSRTQLPADSVADLNVSFAFEDGVLTLLSYLEGLLKARPRLRVFILSWDFSLIYLFERESLTWLRFAVSEVADRLRFVLDREHPTLASHHQKVIVIDDRLAFSGGLDMTQRRWDTSEHFAYDERRVDAGGHCYGPFHDVQMLVEGEAAAALGELVRERWRLATSETLSRPSKSAAGLNGTWPSFVPVDFHDVAIGISRTIPARRENGRMSRPVREVERLFIDSIRRARRFIYIENQYFTSLKIARSLARRLREPDGPEIIMVLPRDQTGFIEESTMGLLRSKALREVELGDRHQRFHCFFPVVEGLGDNYLKVHSKVMIVDDEFLRVGSANLNSRSMGLDTECDLALETEDRGEIRNAIRNLRHRLLAEHLGVEEQQVAEKERSFGSMRRAVRSLLGRERTLIPLVSRDISWVERILPPIDWIDPAQPWGIRRWFVKKLVVLRLFSGLLLLALLLFLMACSSKPKEEFRPLSEEERRQTILPPLIKKGFARSEEAAKYVALCPTVRLFGLETTPFTAVERRLLCGDPEPDAIGIPWSDIPPNQAAYFMRGFLQTRGYHQPVFLQDGDLLFVDAGPVSRLLSLRIVGGPSTWDPPKRRLVEDSTLTPRLLDELEAWALEHLRNDGYPCSKARSAADPLTGEVLITLAPGGERYIRGFEERGDTGLREGVLDRYNAFRVGDLYRDYLIALTRRRTLNDGFLQTYTMVPRCEDAGVTIVRNVFLGPSRTIRVGVGASSDLGARFRASIRRNRIGESASSAEARLQASYLSPIVNRQSVDARFRWFYSHGENRSYVEPSTSYEHAAEVAFANRAWESKLLHGWNQETAEGQFEIRAGPTFLMHERLRGAGSSDVSMTYAEVSARLTSHDFEYYVASPRTGGSVEARALFTLKEWGANFTAQKFQIQGHKLWSLFRYDPPLFIMGTRFDVSSVFSPDEDLTPNLPIRFLTFLGGEQDLRGFDRASLPRSGVGALTGATAGIEARFHKVIWRRADVFMFLDGGLLGRARLKFDRPILLSPGAGFRWETPIGVLRAYLAWRMAIDEKPGESPYGRESRLGFTLGEEF